MTNNDRPPGKGRALISFMALAAGFILTGGMWAAPAYATCSPNARPCIDKIYMKDPTTLVFTWTDDSVKADGFQVRYGTAEQLITGLPPALVEHQFKAIGTDWEIRDVKPGATYVLKVQACHHPIDMVSYSCHEWTEWDEKTFTVPMPEDDRGRTLARVPVDGGGTPPLYLEEQVDLPDFSGPVPSAPTATVAADVDVYNAKNEPDGVGQVVGILRQGGSVKLAGDCAPESWCEVSGDVVPGGHGWVWGHLNLP